MSENPLSFEPGTRVLVCDDDLVTRTMLRACLESWKIEVCEASDGAEALGVLCGEEPPRLAILDWVMPQMDGVEVCRRLREARREPYIYVVLLTSKTEKTEIAEGLTAGADDFLCKPYDPGELQARLKAGERLVRLQSDLWEAKEALRYEATHDQLTGLLNRRALLRSLEAGFSGSAALLCGDLRGFGFINRTMGYQCGDQLLKEVARRIERSAPEGSIVARKGEDQIMVFLANLPENAKEFVERVARKWVERVQQPFEVQEQTVLLDCNVGVSLAPDDASTPLELMEHVEAAHIQAKAQAPGAIAFYNAELHEQLRAKMFLERELRAAVRQLDFSLVYQPIVHLDSAEVIGVEAFLRWNHPERGQLGPGEFMRVAKDSGLIVGLGRWVIEQACSQLRAWKDQGLDLFVNVNLSSRELVAANQAVHCLSLMTAAGLEEHELVVDVSEKAYMTEQLQPVLEALGEGGVAIALDDFGTGLSNLETLRFAKSQFLKVAPSIVAGIPDNRRLMSVCIGVIRLAASLHLRSVAECVETRQQRDYLINNDCHLAQGNFFSPPVPASEIPSLVRNGTLGGEIAGCKG